MGLGWPLRGAEDEDSERSVFSRVGNMRECGDMGMVCMKCDERYMALDMLGW